MLLNSKSEEIAELLDKFENSISELESSLIMIAWYMRGSLSVVDAYNLSESQRKMISKLIDKNLETTKKTGLPFF